MSPFFVTCDLGSPKFYSNKRELGKTFVDVAYNVSIFIYAPIV